MLAFLLDGLHEDLNKVYDHKVFKYFETPLESLSDNDHIVAYRFNQMHRGPGKAKLEILHGEQKKSDSGGDLKLFGTPLVTYINTEPLHQTHSSSMVDDGEENGHIPDVADETSGSLSSRDTETEDIAVDDKELSLSVFLTDYHSFSPKPLESDLVVNPRSVTRVIVKWNEKEHEKYDSSYLKDLPDVHKTSFSAKKTRQEETSLFSCLETFLAEEPLGPDDVVFVLLAKNTDKRTRS